MAEGPGGEARGAFRVTYPLSYPERRRPLVVIAPAGWAILQDISESGMRLRLPLKPTQVVNDAIRITIYVRDNEPLSVEGTVSWIRKLTVAVQLPRGTIPFTVVLDEQRAVRSWQVERSRVRY